MCNAVGKDDGKNISSSGPNNPEQHRHMMEKKL